MYPRQKNGMERYQEVMVAFQESVMKIRRTRPLAERLRPRSAPTVVANLSTPKGRLT